MKKCFLLPVVIFVFGFTSIACRSFGIRANNPHIDAGKDIPKDTLIKLERTRCYGTCPAYRLTIYGDGKVNFEPVYIAGKSEEKKLDSIESKISQEKVREILSEFQKADYFNLGDSDEFSSAKCHDWTDTFSAITYIRYNGSEKSMNHYRGCDKAPKALIQLENRIDEIVNTQQWLKED